MSAAMHSTRCREPSAASQLASRLARGLATTVALACSLLPPPIARAGMGLQQLDGGRLAVFYPTDTADREVRFGPLPQRLAPAAVPGRTNGRLVIISHGSGGSWGVHTDLARALVSAGFVVAVPEHDGDNWRDLSSQGPASWKRRPQEVSATIDRLTADPTFGPLFSADRVGVFGQSAGGFTALALAGGQWSPARFYAHCDRHMEADFPACVGTYARLTGGWLDHVKVMVARGALRQRFADETALLSHRDPRITAAVSGVPAAAAFDPASLAQPTIPLGLVTSGRDIWLQPRFHSQAVLAACQPRCELLAHLPEGGHSILLSPTPPPDVLSKGVRELLADPPGFDRGQLRAVDGAIVEFFRRHLLP